MTANTKSKPGEFDALEKARPDEMIFTLLERDPCAPATILHWCELRRNAARMIKDDETRKMELIQITEAEFIALTMLERQAGFIRPSETLPKATYSGIQREKTKLDELMPKLRADLAEADFHANNALGLARKIRAIDGINDAQLSQISEIAARIHGQAIEHSPHRAALLAESELPLESKSNE